MGGSDRTGILRTALDRPCIEQGRLSHTGTVHSGPIGSGVIKPSISHRGFHAPADASASAGESWLNRDEAARVLASRGIWGRALETSCDERPAASWLFRAAALERPPAHWNRPYPTAPARRHYWPLAGLATPSCRPGHSRLHGVREARLQWLWSGSLRACPGAMALKPVGIVARSFHLPGFRIGDQAPAARPAIPPRVS